MVLVSFSVVLFQKVLNQHLFACLHYIMIDIELSRKAGPLANVYQMKVVQEEMVCHTVHSLLQKV